MPFFIDFPKTAWMERESSPDRLPKELALADISTMAAANRWLAESYWLAHNAAFAVAPAEAGSAFVGDRTGRVRHPVHSSGQ